MQRRDDWLITNFDDAFNRVLVDPNFAVFAGREKLKYDAIRLGKDQFHINQEVFFSKVKGIVVRNGSPLKPCFAKIINRLQDTGIVDKITQVSYGPKT